MKKILNLLLVTHINIENFSMGKESSNNAGAENNIKSLLYQWIKQSYLLIKYFKN